MSQRVDDGSARPKRKKGDKLGFKQDRTDRYLARHGGAKNAERYSKKALAQKDAVTKTAKIKDIKFSDDSRVEFLTTMHKKKNERRVNAMVEGRRKMRRENLKHKQTEREELRKQYNSYAQVPILPDYTFKLPDMNADADDMDDIAVSSDDDAEAVDAKTARRNAREFRRNAEAELQGVSLHTGTAEEDNDAAYAQAVTVDVQPLFAAPAPTSRQSSRGGGGGGKVQGYRGGMDFSDLPDDVATLLNEINAKQKGPSKTKKKVHVTKEMQKYHKIMKHSRKKKGS
jgi:hypothetical protein